MPRKPKFEDLDEALEELGYGDSWARQVDVLQERENIRRANDIARLNEYNAKYPERHRQAVRSYIAKKAEEARPKVGKVFCVNCKKKLRLWDIVRKRCSKCGEKNES